MKYSDFKEEGSESAVKVCVFFYSYTWTHAINCAYTPRKVFEFYKTRLLWICLSLFQAAGKYRQQGRNYIVEDGDIIFFKFNTPNAPKKKPWAETMTWGGTHHTAQSGPKRATLSAGFHASLLNWELVGTLSGPESILIT